MLHVCDIVTERAAAGERVVVVVSALGGVTDDLLSTVGKAVRGDATYEADLEHIATRHLKQLSSVVHPEMRASIEATVRSLLGELTNILRGVYLIRDLSIKTSDAVVSYGERMSSAILAGVIDGATLCDSRDFIKTRKYFDKHAIDFSATDKLIRSTFSEAEPISIVGGFIASDLVTGDGTTLGRGGSDYTAAVIAAALDAEVLEIWTDVDGFMTADPRVVSNAYVIENMSYVEAIELSNFGAKVIYPPTIFPVYHKNIPIVLKNTFNPKAVGTYISKRKAIDEERSTIKGISSVSNACLITIQGLGMVGVIGVNYRIFKALSKAGISVFLVAQAASENNTSIGVQPEDAELATEVLTAEFSQEIAQGEINKVKCECGLAVIAIVGENMKRRPGIAGRLFGTLGRNGINVMAVAQGAAETNISFVVRQEDQRKAMNVLHDSFFLSEYQVLNIFLAGVGLVGSNLLEQIRCQQPKLLRDNSLQIRVVGISNSSKYLLCRDGIDLATYRESLAASSDSATPEKFRDAILEMNIFNSVFVDCTANESIASIYGSLLERSVSVVTANKVAASADYASYEWLKNAARRSGVKFLFETNVGAGLPIINTIGALTNSGDKILKIEAVVSGTLNFIFNEMNENVSFSTAIRMAQEAGYAEPDPRIDLSGMDVVRKLVILSREAGYHIEQSDVEKDLFIPAHYFEGSLDDFWRTIPQLDTDFERRRKELKDKKLRWRFIAVLDNGRAKVSLQAVAADSPFYDLAGSNNVISLTTERYREYPMQIKGYGAGAGVTAAGVFADIISIANIR